MSGRTDIQVAISNECGRLISNAIIYYNSVILSRLKQHYGEEKNTAGLTMLKKFSPVAWRHLNFLEHYIFSGEKRIDIDQMIKNLLQQRKKKVSV